MNKLPHVAVLGATGAVGQEYTVEEAKPDSFKDIDIALFAGGKVSEVLAPEAVRRGAVVIDNSSAFRMDPQVPLIIPEINPEDIEKHRGIIANPNCSTIIMLMALKPIYDLSPIKRVIVSTYQAVSGAGKEGIDELYGETEAVSKGTVYEPKILPSVSLPKHYPIAYNLIPQIDIFLDNKILHDEDITITPTAVRVPVIRSHAESIYVETAASLSTKQIKEAMKSFPGVVLVDDIKKQVYPMPLDTSNKTDVAVGRIRKDLYNKRGINLWVCGDQIRKGAALNTLQIAEYMIAHDMF